MKKISVIIPTYNRKQLLTQTLDSVLQQTYRNIEIIVVDDNSTDETQSYVTEKYKDKILYLKNNINQGASSTRKRGYSHATGDYIVFMDDDDYYTDKNFYSKAIDIFNKTNHRLSFVSGTVQLKNEDKNKIAPRIMSVYGEIDNIEYLKNFSIGYKKPTSTFSTVFNKACLDESNVGQMDTLDDTLIQLRALLAGNAVLLPDIIGVYRVHHNSLSFTMNSEFFINILQGIKEISEIIKERNLFSNPEEWLNQQIFTNSSWYVGTSNPNDIDYKNVLKWCIENTIGGKEKKNSVFAKLEEIHNTTKL